MAATAAAQTNQVNGGRFNITTGPCVLRAGSGSPEGVVTGNPCDTYWRSDAGITNPPVYIKWSGTGTNTGWHAVPGLTRANTWTQDQTISANLLVSGSASIGSMGAGAYALTIAPSWIGTWTGSNWINRNSSDANLRSEWYVDANAAIVTSFVNGGAYRPLDIYAAPTRFRQSGINVGGTGDPGAGNIYLTGNIQTPTYVSQATDWRVTNTGGADFRYVYTDELHAKKFIADLEQALAGGQIIAKSVTTLATSFTAPTPGSTATLTVKDLPSAAGMRVFATGDTVLLRSFTRSDGDTAGPPDLTIGNCFGTVSAYVGNGNGTQSWTFTRGNNSTAPGGGMTNGTVVAADSIVLDYGTTGSGYWETNAIDGQNGVNSPYAQAVTWSNTVINTNQPTTAVKMRVGNLYGITAVSGEYGMIAGDYTNKQYLRASSAAVELYGMDFKMYDGTTNVLAITRGSNAPTLVLGNPVPNTYTSGAGIWMGKDSSDGAYKFRVGDPSATNIAYDPTNGFRVLNNGTVRAQFAANGSGSLATNAISWDASGNMSIVGWSITASALYGTTAGISPGDYPFYAGAAYASRASAPFRVDTSGNVTAGSLTATGNLTFGTTGYVASAGNAWGSGTGVWMGYNSGAYKFRVGNSGGQRIEWDGGNLQLYGYGYSLTSGSGLAFGRPGSEGANSNTISWQDGNVIGGGSSYTWICGPGGCPGSTYNVKVGGGAGVEIYEGQSNILAKFFGNRVSIYQPIGYNPPGASNANDVLVVESSTIKYHNILDILGHYAPMNGYAGCGDDGHGYVKGFDINHGLVWKVNCQDGYYYQ